MERNAARDFLDQGCQAGSISFTRGERKAKYYTLVAEPEEEITF